ncbi:MAG: class I SAM-dependent methyltransferase [Anaerolineae bacterium]|jgi:SAM-dependent methyltransferase|nr:class I SAM-dependent methyltransferase [Anaerolineae bacterium]
MKNSIQAFIRRAGYEIHRYHAPLPLLRDDPAALARLTQRLQQPPVKLHFGCGPRVLRGWLNFDLSYEPYEKYLQYYGDRFYAPDVRGTADDLFVHDVSQAGLPLPDNSVDVVFHEDFIEHLSQRTQLLFLAETWRVLKPGGVHRINTPSITASMRQSSDFTRGFAGVYVQEWDLYAHLNILSPGTLEELARLVGYSSVTFNHRDGSVSPLIPPEYRPGQDRPEDGNLFADLIK